MNQPERKQTLTLPCDCVGTCTLLHISYEKWSEDPHQWTWEFYTNNGYDGSLRHRLQVIWGLLRGKRVYFHGTVHTTEDMERLQNFLTETLGKC